MGADQGTQAVSYTIRILYKWGDLIPFLYHSTHTPTTPINTIDMPAWLHSDSQELKDYETVCAVPFTGS